MWKTTARWATAAAVLVSATGSWAGPDDDDEFEFSGDLIMGEMLAPSAAEMGATPGGAQDIQHAREHIRAGGVPLAATFTPEGLFSEHDLPLSTGRACTQHLCLDGAAVRADLVAQPEVRYLAQLSFASGLDPATFKRPALNLVAVVDKSGSMSGRPLLTVRASLRTLVTQLGPRDRLAIVLYGDTTHVYLPSTPVADKDALIARIDAIASAGSTNLEAGLRLGFEVARAARATEGFEGLSRVMLFTDERPNVGATDARSFMGMARRASAEGVGLTTIGVGTHFGAELAAQVSSVRGGNLFFFPGVEEMTERFRAELDTLVVELAYDLRLRLTPGPGHRIVGLYGLPGDLLQRTPEGGLEMTVETVFLSRRRGGIFVALAPDGAGLPVTGAPVRADLHYVATSGARFEDRIDLQLWSGGPLPLGLARGRLLVDEITTLKAAAALHHEHNDQEGAWRMVRALRQRMAQTAVPGLDAELTLLDALDQTLTRLSGHQGEGPRIVARDPVSGLPR